MEEVKELEEEEAESPHIAPFLHTPHELTDNVPTTFKKKKAFKIKQATEYFSKTATYSPQKKKSSLQNGSITPTHANALSLDEAPNFLSMCPFPSGTPSQQSELPPRAKTNNDVHEQTPDLIESTSKTSLLMDRQTTSAH